MKSDVLVIGSTQFVGSNVCNYLMQHTRLTVTGIDDLSHGIVGNMQASLSSVSRFTFYPLKLSDVDLASKVIDMVSPRFVIFDMTRECKLEEAITLLNATSGAEKCIMILPTQLDDDCNKLLAYLNETGYANGMCDIYSVVPCHLYGPRQSLSEEFALILSKHLMGLETSGITDVQKERLYIKDLFHNIVMLMDEHAPARGNYELRTRTTSSDADILSFIQSLTTGDRIRLNTETSDSVLSGSAIEAISHFDLESSVEHTLCWYSDNRWAWRST